MECYISKYSGLCVGASEAVKSAYNNIGSTLWMYGELLHNPLIISNLISSGVSIAHEVDEIPSDTKVLIRAHGVQPYVIEELYRRNIEVIDKTCPKVKRIHEIVHKIYDSETKIIVLGDSLHPEVLGIVGWCSSEPFVFNNKEQYIQNISHLKKYKRLIVVFQTTFEKEKFCELKLLMSQNHPNAVIFDTICDDVSKRQQEVKELALKCDLIIIVGGKRSSNSIKLFNISSSIINSIHVEDEDSISIDMIKNYNRIGICNGASTPQSSVEKVIEKLRYLMEIEGRGFIRH